MDAIRRPIVSRATGEQNLPLFGTGYPILATSDRIISDESISDIRAILEHIHVRRNLAAVERMAFAGWSFDVIPPEDFSSSKKKEAEIKREITNKLWEFNRTWQIQRKIPATWEHLMAYRWDVHEIAMGRVGKWIVPVYWEVLPPHSFSRTPPQLLGNRDYIPDRLLPGVVYEVPGRRYLFFQTQSLTSEPRQIPPENVFYIQDPRATDPQGRSYLAGLVATIKSHNLSRMSLNQTISRGGSPNMIVRVKRAGDLDDLGLGSGGDPGSQYSPWWQYGEELARRQGKDSRIVIPEDIELEWPDLKVALNPTEADHYFIQEIVDALVPVDPMKQLGTSLAKSSKELLEYLEKIFGGYREMCGDPYADLLTYIININGYEGWAIENVWQPLTPADRKTDLEHSLRSYQAGAITVSRFYEETGRLPPSQDELMQLYREMLIRAGRPDLLPELEYLKESGNGSRQRAEYSILSDLNATNLPAPTSGTELGIETLLQNKMERVIKVLREFGYFDEVKYG
ncbi:MAG: hypothetical protein N3G75_09190 [Methanothrix sp.]|nr:hypothetical protein [Methanothrix sp.]MCX8207981.1 hypothetical protein [Methanothrix sp.]